MKRFEMVVVIMVIGLILGEIVGFSSSSAYGDEPLDKVAFIAQNMANESQAFAAKEFQKYGKDYGFDVLVLDSKGDAQVNSQNVENAIAQGVKVIFINPNDKKCNNTSITSCKRRRRCCCNVLF